MKERLAERMTEWGLSFDAVALDRFEEYTRLLHERGSEMNLIADTDPEEISVRHILDSLAVARMGIRPSGKAIDVGTGAGFPGVPLKILLPEMEMTLLDSLGKRLEFLDEVRVRLGLDKVTILNARAEEAALDPAHRDRYDYAFSRAVARMNVLAEICLPFVKKGGQFCAMKSQHSIEEAAEAENAIRALGGRYLPPYDYQLPEKDMDLRILRVEKVAATPKGYPRRFAKIKQKPL
jgi:16S rRNA (guanine527-N7)-methyltransferase